MVHMEQLVHMIHVGYTWYTGTYVWYHGTLVRLVHVVHMVQVHMVHVVQLEHIVVLATIFSITKYSPILFKGCTHHIPYFVYRPAGESLLKHTLNKGHDNYIYVFLIKDRLILYDHGSSYFTIIIG